MSPLAARLIRLTIAILLRAALIFLLWVIYIVVAITRGYHQPLLAVALVAIAIITELIALPPITRAMCRRLRVPDTGVRWIDRG